MDKFAINDRKDDNRQQLNYEGGCNSKVTVVTAEDGKVAAALSAAVAVQIESENENETGPLLLSCEKAEKGLAASNPVNSNHDHDRASSEGYNMQNHCNHRHAGRRLLTYLYISYLLCRWGDRMWEFAVGLFMIEIWKHSLLLASLYGLVETASVVVFGVVLGECVDKFPRLKVIQTSLALQNVSIIAATLAILILLLQSWPTGGIGFKVFITLILLVNVLGGISALASLATKISLERDWVVVLAAENPSENLTKMNAVMRRIDLSCTLLAAIFVGFIMSAVSVVASAVLIATWNITCVGIEYWLLLTVYNETPRLHERKILYHLASKLEMTPTIAQEDIKTSTDTSYSINLKYFPLRLSELREHGITLWHKFSSLPLFEGWKVYLKQDNMLAGIAFSLLSVSVLSFGTLMTASLKWRGCPAYVLGLARGCAALIGICATLSYPFLHTRLQTLKAGLFSIILQWSFLTLCVVSVWLTNLTASTVILMAGAAAARAGLWMFDLSVTQLMQVYACVSTPLWNYASLCLGSSYRNLCLRLNEEWLPECKIPCSHFSSCSLLLLA